ncbi:MAG: ABC transporter ATP-binding protein, partial [Oscillospiraceae bacterium]
KAKDYLQLAGYYYPFWDKAYAKALCEEFKIDLKQKICKMNKGMLSMLTIIIALASRSDITILDEPVAGLDVFMRDKFYTLLLKDYAETMRTFIISTHIIEEASNLLEEVIVLNNGVIEEKENTQQLLYISGKAEDVDNITSGFTVVNSEVLGNLKNVCVRTTETEKISSLATAHNLDVATVPLQKIFVYLTGEKA